MDLAYFLNKRLSFVEYFHRSTTTFFDEVKRKIGAGEPPYVVPQLKKMGESGWLPNYRAFFDTYLNIDWSVNGVDFDLLEQVVLTRNDLAHSVDLLSLNAYQQKSHSGKYPESAFVDPKWKTMLVHSPPLTVSG